MEADKPGEEASGEFRLPILYFIEGWSGLLADVLWLIFVLGAKGVEYPQRFFARDFAGNRLEFSL
jgi:hypothetical protein